MEDQETIDLLRSLDDRTRRDLCKIDKFFAAICIKSGLNVVADDALLDIKHYDRMWNISTANKMPVIRTFTITYGPPGSGKSTVHDLLLDNNYHHIKLKMEPVYTVLTGHPQDDESICICPCGKYAEILEDDYVTTPMVWCDSCGGRFVICPHCEGDKMSESDLESLHTQLENDLSNIEIPTDEDLKSCMDPNCRIANLPRYNDLIMIRRGETQDHIRTILQWETASEQPLMFITHICTRQIYSRQWPDGTTIDDVLTRLSNDTLSELPKLDEDSYNEDYEPQFWLPLNKFNVEDYDLPNLDTSHDAIYVFLKTHCLKCEAEMKVVYWGD